MKNSVGTAGKGLIKSGSVALKGQRGGDTTLGRWGRKAAKRGFEGKKRGTKKSPRCAGQAGILYKESIRDD